MDTEWPDLTQLVQPDRIPRGYELDLQTAFARRNKRVDETYAELAAGMGRWLASPTEMETDPEPASAQPALKDQEHVEMETDPEPVATKTPLTEHEHGFTHRFGALNFGPRPQAPPHERGVRRVQWPTFKWHTKVRQYHHQQIQEQDGDDGIMKGSKAPGGRGGATSQHTGAELHRQGHAHARDHAIWRIGHC